MLRLRHPVVFSVEGRGQSGKDFRDQPSTPVSVGVVPHSREVLVFRSSFIGDAATSLLVTPPLAER